MKENKLVRTFIIGTFVSLYILVSSVSTIHSIEFFRLSNPEWLAVTLALGFEIGAAASLASLIILDKMNKTIVWSLFITITLMQMQGNMFHAFINLSDFSSWSELFNLIEEDLIYQKRILAFVSGAILPLIALGFIKSLVDYIKPEDEDNETLTSGVMDDNMLSESNNGFDTQPSKEYFEDIKQEVKQPTREEREQILAAMVKHDEDLGLYDDFDNTLLDGLEDEEFVDYPNEIISKAETEEEEWDEDHALDQVLNNMVNDMNEEDIYSVGEYEASVPIETIKYNINPTSVGAMVQKINTPHLPQDEQLILNEALRKKAQENKDSFIKGKRNDN